MGEQKRPTQDEGVYREVLKALPELAEGLRRSMPDHAGEGTVSPARMKALIHLAEYGPQTMTELAEGLRVTTPSATGLVTPLVECGHIVRERDEEDRRMVRVRLSPRAEELAEEALKLRRSEVRNALQGMSEEAREHFLEGLNRLIAVYRQRDGEG